MAQREADGRARPGGDAPDEGLLDVQMVEESQDVTRQAIERQGLRGPRAPAAAQVRRDDPVSIGERPDERQHGLVAREAPVQEDQGWTLAVFYGEEPDGTVGQPQLAHPAQSTSGRRFYRTIADGVRALGEVE